jgi:atlastin
MAVQNGQPLTILSFSTDADSDDKIILYENELKKILLHPEVAQRKIAIVSILGAFREGKSFLLGYMLRYMYANVSKLT